MASEQESAAWDDPSWVLAVMHYPSDPVMRTSYRAIRAAQHDDSVAQPVLDRAVDGMAETLTNTARRGIVAGHVLMVLYTMADSPWRLPEPSLARAIYVCENFAKLETFRDGVPMPGGHTKIEACLDSMRPVAHLWAAFRLHCEFPTRPHDELLLTADGVRTLLGIARGIQTWALQWEPARTNSRVQPVPLLGARPWLVPEGIPALRPRWADASAPDWLLKVNDTYRRRSRGF